MVDGVRSALGVNAWAQLGWWVS